MFKRFVVLACLGALTGLSACGPRDPVELPDAGTELPPDPVPAVTSFSPEAGPFNGSVTVTFTTEPAATIFLTTDGSDPAVEGPSRQSGENTLTVELTQTTTLTFFSRTAEGAAEPVRSATFIRAGGPAGTIRGVVVVNTLALNHAVALFVNAQPRGLGTFTEAQEVPFFIENLSSGRHRLRAVADENDDGTFFPLLEVASAPQEVELDLTDPYKASAEGIRIYLGAPGSGLCAIQGKITHPRPLAGETIRISAIDPGALTGGADLSGLLGQLQNGHLILVSADQTEYRFLLNDLEPGSYALAPMLTTLGFGGLAMNLQVNPLAPVSCQANKVASSNLELGPVGLTGTLTLEPATPPDGLTWGVVAARNVSFTKGIQAVLMPGFYSPNGEGAWTGGFGGRGLRSNSAFGVRAFTSADGTMGNPLTDALMWTLVPFGGAPAHVAVQTGTTDATVDFTVQLP